MYTDELRRAKDEGNATARPVQKVSIDKVKEEKINFETMFTQSLPVPLRSRGKQKSNQFHRDEEE